jgi:5S rRNA maturation endonuclease (ribonuclease M5)
MQSIDWQKIAPEVALELLGEPKIKKTNEWRWNNKGSLVLNLEAGTWWDFENDTGGGIIDLIKHLNHDVNTILKRFGYDLTLRSNYSFIKNSNNPPVAKSNVKSFTREQMIDLYKQAIVKVKYADNFMVLRFPENHHIKQKYAPFSLNPDTSWSLKRPDMALLPIYYQPNGKDKPVLICEGEKAMRGAEQIYDGDCVTWHGGVNAWDKADWSPIFGKEVYIFPDNDTAGFKCANAIAKYLKRNDCKVKVAQPPKDFADKDDLYDAYESGYFDNSKALESYIQQNAIKPPRGSLYFQTVNEILDNMKEPDWLVDRCIERGTVTSIFGAPKSGKSFIGIAMGCAIATGEDFYGYKTQPATVLYLAGEGYMGVGRRIKAYEEFYGRSLTDKPLLVSNRGSRIGDDEEFAMLQDVCRDIEAEHGNIGMIVVDTLARNYGLNENSTEDMNKFIQRIDELKEEFNASMVIVHHTGHGANGRARGSSVLPAALDYEFKVVRDPNSDDKSMLVTLKQTLVKDGTPIDDLYFQFKEQTLYGYEGVTSGVLALTDQSPRQIGLSKAREETLAAIEKIQREKAPHDPVSYWVKHSILLSVMDIKESTLKSRLRDLKDNELVHYKEGYGYQSKSLDNEVF